MRKAKGVVQMGMAPGDTVTLWYDDMCEVWAQGLWAWGAVGRLQIMPVRMHSLAAITARAAWEPADKPRHGGVIYRPANLVLQFKRDVTVNLECVSRDAMRAWFEKTKPWRRIGEKPETTW